MTFLVIGATATMMARRPASEAARTARYIRKAINRSTRGGCRVRVGIMTTIRMPNRGRDDRRAAEGGQERSRSANPEYHRITFLGYGNGTYSKLDTGAQDAPNGRRGADTADRSGPRLAIAMKPARTLASAATSGRSSRRHQHRHTIFFVATVSVSLDQSSVAVLGSRSRTVEHESGLPGMAWRACAPLSSAT